MITKLEYHRWLLERAYEKPDALKPRTPRKIVTYNEIAEMERQATENKQDRALRELSRYYTEYPR